MPAQKRKWYKIIFLFTMDQSYTRIEQTKTLLHEPRGMLDKVLLHQENRCDDVNNFIRGFDLRKFEAL